MDKIPWRRIFITLSVLFLVFSVRYNPEFTASAFRSGWEWVRGFGDSFGRFFRAL